MTLSSVEGLEGTAGGSAYNASKGGVAMLTKALAYELARGVYQAVYADAERHVEAVLRREDDAAPAAEPAFFERFGGLTKN